MNATPVLLVAALVVAGCAAPGAAEPSDQKPTRRSSSTVTGRASSTTSRTGVAVATSTVRTSGGDVTVQARDGRLELVDVVAASGWVGNHQQLDDPTRLLVSFERKGSRVDVTIDLTPSGITTSSRSVTTG